MKKFFLFLFTCVTLSLTLCTSQKVSNIFTKEGKIFVQYNDGVVTEIVSHGKNSVIGFSPEKKNVIYLRMVQQSQTRGLEFSESSDQFSVFCFDLKTNDDEVLFTTCLDGQGGTQPEYANSDIYPFSYLGNWEGGILTKDGEKLFFQTSAWMTCPAIHYYNLATHKLIFFVPGWLHSVTEEGVVTGSTGIGDNGRYTQQRLYDFDGNFIKELSPKEY